MSETNSGGRESRTFESNPFRILDVSPRDGRERITERFEALSASGSETEAAEAQKILLHPRRRLAAEVAWFAGFDAVTMAELLARFDADPAALDNLYFSPLTNANILSWRIEAKTASDPGGDWVVRDVSHLLDFIDGIDFRTLKADLDVARSMAGFAPTLLEQVDEAVREHRHKLLSIANSALRAQELSVRATTLAVIATELQDSNAADDVIDTYEQDASERIQQRGRDVLNLFPDNPLGQRQIQFGVQRLEHMQSSLSDYVLLAKPIVCSRVAGGLNHQFYGAPFSIVHQFALHNEHLTPEQRISFLSSLLEIGRPDRELHEILEGQIQEQERLISRVVAVAVSSAPESADTPLRRLETTTGPTAVGPKSQLSTGWKVAIAIACLMLIGIVQNARESKSETALETPSVGARLVETQSPDQCAGAISWWNSTQDRVDQSNAIVATLGPYTSNYDLAIAQQKIYLLAGTQRSSNPPPAALALNQAYARLYDFIAYDLLDTTLSKYESDQQFSALSKDVDAKSNAFATACHIRFSTS